MQELDILTLEDVYLFFLLTAEHTSVNSVKHTLFILSDLFPDYEGASGGKKSTSREILKRFKGLNDWF